MSQVAVLERAFAAGKRLTARQIRGVYKIQSPSKVVSRLRRNVGLPVKSVRKGVSVPFFMLGKPRYDVIVKGYEARLGAPSAEVLAAGFRAVSSK